MATDEKAVRRRLELYLAELRHISPLLNGHDLIALGVPQGPLVGKLLAILHDETEGSIVQPGPEVVDLDGPPLGHVHDWSSPDEDAHQSTRKRREPPRLRRRRAGDNLPAVHRAADGPGLHGGRSTMGSHALGDAVCGGVRGPPATPHAGG